MLLILNVENLMKNQNNNVIVLYEKVYTDDLSIHIPKLFSEQKGISDICINRYWAGAIDGFFSSTGLNYITCIKGNIRVVIANSQGNDNWKFNQYFLGEFDGKILKIVPETWFAIHNLNHEPSILINANEGSNISFERMSPKIFNWNSKRC